ncbi:MAG: MBL fold metallo-hydrolase [Oscillibacter sp.]|nr:MBL fold metallo-hydrolase [Oscillibacter sp.]
MYELIRVSELCYYIQCPAKIGVVRTGESNAVLIDSGNDKNAGKKALKILQERNWHLQAVFNTHSHADHIGGNRFLQERTGCKIYAPGIERDFTRRPVLEPTFLYGGCPPSELRHKFLMAQESDALPLTADVLPDGISVVPLPGHSFDMVGFRTKDSVVFLADCLSSRETLDKYRVGFLTDVKAYLETLERVMHLDAAVFVPSHAQTTDDIRPLARYNMEKVREVADDILDICQKPASFERILQGLFDKYGLAMNFEQYALVGSAVRSYLSWLKERGELRAFFENNALLWARN